MKSKIFSHIFFLIILVACSTPNKIPIASTSSSTMEQSSVITSRAVAEIQISDSDISERKIKKTIQGIFHSYVLGQVLLQKFDQDLDKDPQNVLNSDNYHELLAIRSAVDGFEEEFMNLYLKLVTVTAAAKYTNEQKENAQKSLDVIGEFLQGITADKKALPKNLEPLILGNLREKQTELYEELKIRSEDANTIKNDPEAVEVFKKNMILLRATRMLYYKNLKNYKVNQDDLNQVVNNLSKDVSFKKYKREIRKSGKRIKRLQNKVIKARSTSSDIIFPATTSAGNITGRGFPKNTWSLTYDDGPAGKTTPEILKNLIDRKQKATFFVLAKKVEALPAVSKSIVDAGMDLASHSYDHPQITKLGPGSMDKQISGSKKIINEKLGQEVKLFRLPYGAGVSNATIRQKIAESKMIHVFWNVDTLDWQDKNPQSIFERSVKQMKASSNNAGVVLFHDIHSQSVTASTMLMDYFIEQKINVCTVQSVVDQLNKGLPSCEQ